MLVLILVVLALGVILGGALLAASRPKVVRPRMAWEMPPWQPTWVAETPQEMWVQGLEREVYYGTLTFKEAVDVLQREDLSRAK